MDPQARINELELSVKTMAEYLKKHTELMKNQAVMKEHFDEWKQEMKKKDEEINSMKSRYDELNSRLEELKLITSKKAEKSGDAPISDTYVKRLDNLEKQLQDMQKVSKRTSGRGKESVVKISVDKSVQDLNEKIEELAATVNKLKTEGDTDKVKDELKKEISSLREEIGSKLNEFLGKAIESNTKSLTDMDRKEILLLKTELEAVQQRVANFYDSLERLKEMKNIDVYEDLREDVADVRRTVEEEAAFRISTDKDLQKIKQKLDELSAYTSRFMVFEQLDYEKLKEVIERERKFDEELDKRVNTEAAKVVTKHLNEFSRVLDKRLPNLVTHDDLAKLEARLKARPAIAYKSPDGLNERLEILEFTLNSLIDELKERGGGNSRSFIIE